MMLRKFMLYLFLIILLGCGTSQKVKKTPIEVFDNCREYYDVGSKYFEKEMFDDASRYLEKAVECSSMFVDAYMLLGDAQYECKDYSKALEQYKTIESDLPESAKLYMMKGRCYKMLKQRLKATEEYLKAIEKSDNKLIPYYHLILMYLVIKDYENAQKYIKEAFIIAPDDPGLNCMMGDVYKGYGDKARAQKHYKAAMSHYNTSKHWYKKSFGDSKWGSYARNGVKRVDWKLKGHRGNWYGDD